MGDVNELVRLAAAQDIGDVSQMLDDFNTEFDEPTPGVATLTQRIKLLMEEDVDILIVGDDPPSGIAG